LGFCLTNGVIQSELDFEGVDKVVISVGFGKKVKAGGGNGGSVEELRIGEVFDGGLFVGWLGRLFLDGGHLRSAGRHGRGSGGLVRGVSMVGEWFVDLE
jgi:hypothetical protein